jgi:hypothetical protein
MSKISATLAAMLLCAPGAIAQARMVGVPGRPLPAPGHGDFSAGRAIGSPGVPPFANHFHHHFGRTAIFYGGWPYWEPSYYDYEPEAIIPAPRAETPVAAPIRPEPIPDAVLLELHGDQWVKVNFATNVSNGSSQPIAQAEIKELPAAVLVYRDGHTEELTSYSIMGPTIYTKADYWSTGKWTRKIHVADLDVPATLQRNHDRGVRFDLPSGPDEIVLRP